MEHDLPADGGAGSLPPLDGSQHIGHGLEGALLQQGLHHAHRRHGRLRLEELHVGGPGDGSPAGGIQLGVLYDCDRMYSGGRNERRLRQSGRQMEQEVLDVILPSWLHTVHGHSHDLRHLSGIVAGLHAARNGCYQHLRRDADDARRLLQLHVGNCRRE